MTTAEKPAPLPGIEGIEPYRPGESAVPGVARPIKLSSNENPFGPSPRARAAYIAAAEQLALYPDGAATALRQAIGARYGLDPARIICGTGSNEMFYLLGRAYLGAGEEMIETEHAFSVYRLVGQQSNAVIRTAKNVNLRADVDNILALVSPRTKIVFLDNPNNPTGTYVPFDEVRRLHAGLPRNVLLVIDAAYAEYVRANDYAAGIELVAEAENVVMTRTFSKIYGMAALRLGWAYGPPAVIDALNKTRQPFNLTAPAAAAGAAAIADLEFEKKSADHNAAERARVAAALGALGLEITPSAANFLLVHFPPHRDAPQADAFLRKAGFILRRMETYGLPHALRLSIGAAADNSGVIAALREFMA